LPQFEGPFDLLLFFIERDELDIYNIPIAKITNDFLEYIHQMEELNIDIASEFILVASTLMRIKAKMLLPRRELDEMGNEIDPREELVQRLVEYKRYKSVIDDLKTLEKTRQAKSVRGNVSQELKQLAGKALIDSEWESLSLFKLLKTFDRMLKRLEETKNKPKHTVIRYPYTVRGEQDFLLDVVKKAQKANFEAIFESVETRIHAIFRFLALLELIQLNHLKLLSGEGINNFWLEVVE
jgi:segregation and condensation protein A